MLIATSVILSAVDTLRVRREGHWSIITESSVRFSQPYSVTSEIHAA